ncbi:MAG: PqqD family protein [Rivularia sp. (in: Bacteria)]|nr:PqqD family protein [Rivularia sp. MS3]
MNQATSIFNQKLSISENALSTQVNGEIVILHYESESYYTLDAVATKFWQLFTDLDNLEKVIQQLIQIYLVDEVSLRRDVNSFVEELAEEELLISCDIKAEEIKKSNQPKEEQPEQQNAENIDNRLPYEPPKLHKHGKVNDTTLTNLFPGVKFDGFFGPGRDMS